MNANEMYERIRSIAEGKLVCECGNAQWGQFLFIEGGPDAVIAACKRCAAIYEYSRANDLWTFKTKPEK